MARGASVSEAAGYAGVGRSTVYAWAEGDAAFEKAWHDADAEAMEALRRRAYELAMGGNVRLITFLLESAERRGAGAKGQGDRAGVIEIVGIQEGERKDGDFIEFVEA